MFNCPSQTTNGDADDRQSSSPIEAVRAANEEVSKVCDDSFSEVWRIKMRNIWCEMIILYLSSIFTTMIFIFTFQGFLADMENPYLTGEKLHVAAKKGLGY